MRSLSVGVSLLVPCPIIKLPEPSLSIRLSRPPLGTDSSISGVASTNCNLSLKVD